MKASRILACLSATAFAASMVSMVSFADEQKLSGTITYAFGTPDDNKNPTVAASDLLVDGNNGGKWEDVYAYKHVKLTLQLKDLDSGLEYGDFGVGLFAMGNKSWNWKDEKVETFEADGSAVLECDVTADKFNPSGDDGLWGFGVQLYMLTDSQSKVSTTNTKNASLDYTIEVSDLVTPQAIKTDAALSKPGMSPNGELVFRSESAKLEEEPSTMQDGGWEGVNKLEYTIRLSDDFLKSGEWLGGAIGLNAKATGWKNLDWGDDGSQWERSVDEKGEETLKNMEKVGDNLYKITYVSETPLFAAENVADDPWVKAWIQIYQDPETEFPNVDQIDIALMNISAYEGDNLIISANNTTPGDLPTPTPTPGDAVECPCGCGCTEETCKVWDKEKQCCGCGCSDAVELDAVLGFATSGWYPQDWETTTHIVGDGDYSISFAPKADDGTPVEFADAGSVFVIDIKDVMAGDVYDQKDESCPYYNPYEDDETKKEGKTLRDLKYEGFKAEITSITVDGKEIPFDNSLACYGNIENYTTNYRMEVYNAYGPSAKQEKASIDPTTFKGESFTVNFKVSGLGKMSGKCKCQATKAVSVSAAKTEVVENTRAFEATGKYGYVFKGEDTIGEVIPGTDVTFSVDKPEVLAVSAPAATDAAATAGEGETTGVTVKSGEDGIATVELKPGEVSEDTDVTLTATAADGTTASTVIKVKNKAADDTTTSDSEPEEEETEEPEEEEEESSSTTSSTASSSTASTAAATTAAAGATDNNPATGAAALGTVGLLLAGAALAVSKKKD